MMNERAIQSAFNWQTFSRAEVLKKRILFTLGVLIVYRLCTYIPLPGVNPQVMLEITRRNASGFLGMLDMLSGGALGRATIMALNVMPYITASIIVQLLTAMIPHFEALRKEGETGRKKLNQYTRYLTVGLATAQAYTTSVMLEGLTGASGSLVFDPGWFFRFGTVITLVGGTFFVVWLGEQITARGIGNGLSMIIYAGIVANLPQSAIRTLELGRTGAVHISVILAVLALLVAVIALIVFVERGYRRVTVQYPKRQVGRMMSQGEVSYLPIKINSSGVLPPIFATSVLMFPSLIASASFFSTSSVASTFLQYFGRGQVLFILLYVALIVFFAFFYTSIVFNPEETAENLRKSHGFIPGYKPGKMTVDYFDYLLTRLTVIGALYLSFVCVLPEILMSQVTLSFFFSGTSLLILVSVTMDTVAQVQTHLISYQYEGLLKNRYPGGK
ncbi:preprotein translocase subunit SecY [Candidatus Hepatobacter penaei]|uniref:preprotein translocase subunit SecY n=1 Tax=Candidatus Hepatobacter penaei TaxID=1274402 RepID=UPI000A5A9308|nr:preprotein translocase subunit SecY [Candidatus Hepatobacter penaei]TGW15907.1 preprotein translocase subunit SecY [bacterium NHP-B]